MKTIKIFSAVVSFLIASAIIIPASVHAQATMPIGVPLKQSESDHFVYIYEEPLDHKMSDLIKSCEDAHTILSPLFNWTPKHKTIVMYSDAQDIHNGWATVYPRPMMTIYASDAPPGSTIYEPGNYIRRTVFHEYAHLLCMDAQYGFDATLTSIFGRVLPYEGDPLSFTLMLLAAPPGVLAPRWYQEGLSTWAETEFVGPGRGRSTRVDMMMRMAVADNRVLSGNEWFPEFPEWPYGNVTYLYGLKTFEYIHDTYSFENDRGNAPGTVSDAVAHSFMFSFDNRARLVTGKPFSLLAREAMVAEIARQDERIKKLKAEPMTATRRLTDQRLIVTKPRFGPDGRSIYFSGREESDRNTLFRYDTERNNLVKLTSARTTIDLFTDLAPSPDHRAIYYTRLNIQGRDRVRNEVYRLDTADDRSQLIATQGRYRYPAISPDGKQMAAIVTREGIQSLVVVPLASAGDVSTEKTIVTAPRHYTLVDPAFTPDGRAIVYVQARERESQLRRVDLRSNKGNIVVSWPCIILSPVFHPRDGHLIFVSDKNGVYNLYRIASLSNAVPQALTNVLGGIFNPDFSPDGTLITAAAYDSYGYYLTVMDYDALAPVRNALPIIAVDWKHFPSNRTTTEIVEGKANSHAVSHGDYNSFTNIKFNSWAPWLTLSEDGVMGGFSAAFSDPTEFQNLYIRAGIESHYGTPIGGIVYRYSGLYPLLTVYGATQPEYYNDLVKATDNTYYDYDEEVRTAGIAATIPLIRVDWETDLTVGYQIADRSPIDESTDDYRGKSLVTRNLFDGTESSLWARLSFFNATAFGRSHSFEDGRFITVTGEWSDDSLGSDVDRTRFRGNWYEYVKLPWAENHVIKLEGVYAAGSGDETAQGLFGLGGYVSNINSLPGLDRNIILRGYPMNYQVGDEVIKGGVAYRLPLFRRYKNVNATSPFYINQIFGEVYYEGGRAKGGSLSGSNDSWLNAAGVEVNLSTTLLRILPVSPGIGVVYAFDRDKRNQDDSSDDKLQLYISIKATVNF